MRSNVLFVRVLVGSIISAMGIMAFAGTSGDSSNSSRSPESYQPIADPAAIVQLGHARFTVLTPQLIRMEWAADGKFEDHASFAFLNRRLPVPDFHTQIAGRGARRTLTLDTAALHLVYKTGKDDDRFTVDDLSITLDVAGQKTTWRPGLVDSGNLGGTTRTLDRVKGAKTELEPGLLSRDGWTLIDDTQRPLFDSADFSMAAGEQSPWPWALQRPTGDRTDWYFFGYGHQYRKALSDFIKVAGPIPLPPRYAFGNWWSRYWAYSDQELNELVTGYQSRNIPLDVLVIDMDWHLAFHGGEVDQSGHRKGWSGYTWNRNLFPQPEIFLNSLHERGLKVTLNLHPASGVQPFEEAYPAMATAMGQDPKQQKYVPFRITDRRFVDNYFGILHHPLEKQGVDFWWLDWQQESNTDMAGVNPTFWLNYLHFTDQEREGKRPMLFHRWGGLGNHRYQIGFSGDVVSGWDSLAFQPGFTAQAANVGYAYWSHDIGGHLPGVVGAELYTRWVQFGAFSPILRTHTTKNPDAERRVWAFPEPYSDVMADTMRLRYAWIPYIYTEARRTYDTGIAFIRPLYYDWPEQPEAYHAQDEYMFGDQVIVAPVVHPVDPATQLATESIWLPEGDWIEQSTGKHIHGPNRSEREFSLEQIPLYMRAGAIVPMQPPMLYTGAKPVDPLILNIAPLTDRQKSSYTLYEDSSEGRAYMTGEFCRTELHASRKKNVLTVTVDAPQGTYPGMVKRRALQLELPGDWPPIHVEVNGQPLSFTERSHSNGWWFNGDTLTTTILTNEIDTIIPVEIVITRDPQLQVSSNLLEGFTGKMENLRRAYNDTQGLGSIDDLVEAMQTGDRIGYHPESALKEIEQLPKLTLSATASLEIISGAQRPTIAASGQNGSISAVATEAARTRAQRLANAKAALHQILQ
jgi:alpha-glucosidase (family GH31 glycosyl hydrolase)